MSNSILKEKLNNTIIGIFGLSNTKTNIEGILNQILYIIKDSLNIPAAFICLYNNISKSLSMFSQAGFDTANINSSCYPKIGRPCTGAITEKCAVAYGKSEVCSEDIQNVLYGNRFAASDLAEEMSVIHVPLLSDNTGTGILHIIVPKKLKEHYLDHSHLLLQLSNGIEAKLKTKKLENELQKYADNLEQIIKMRTDELREKDAQLVQAGKLATLGEMATGIAHEINQPLGAISLIVQGIQKAKAVGKLTDSLLTEKLESIHMQIERINKIIKHLRVFGRSTPGTAETIDINKPLKDVFELIGRQLESHNISVEFELESDLLVPADSNRLEQVFLNIISNARDALDEQEDSLFQLKRMKNVPKWVQEWEKKITIRSYRLSNKVIVEIEDTAYGMPKHVLDKLFEPFFTTKEVGKGTGLGLYISYGIIRDYGGEIKVNSKPGIGSVFSVILPSASGV
jgi:two-component system NtrC family sensor kinase